MKKLNIEPYLFFGGRCEEALEFYKSALVAEMEYLMRFKESPEPSPPGMAPDDWDDECGYKLKPLEPGLSLECSDMSELCFGATCRPDPKRRHAAALQRYAI